MRVDIEDFSELKNYLNSRDSSRKQVRSLRKIKGGVSNRTVWVEWADGEAWVLKQALPKLRVEVDWYSDVARIHREALALRYLVDIAPAGSITPFIFEDREHHLLAMKAVPVPHENWKEALMDGRLQLEHARQFGHLLGKIHKESAQRADELSVTFGERDFFESLRLEPYYVYTGIQVAEATAFLSGLVEETRACRLTLVHGDYSPKNILIHSGRLILLDHEVVHFGDPAFDIGFSLTHFLSKANHLPGYRAAFIDGALAHWAGYREALGCQPWFNELEPRAVRHTLGCLLARIDGRSPLEYLSAEEKARQRVIALSLMKSPPSTISELIAAINFLLESHVSD